MQKPIRRGGDYIRDSSGNPVMFTKRQAVLYASKMAAKFSRQINCMVSLKGVRDCGEYWTYTIG